jgi:hypothetical protein
MAKSADQYFRHSAAQERRRRLKTRQVPLAAQHVAQRIRFAPLPCGRKAQVTDQAAVCRLPSSVGCGICPTTQRRSRDIRRLIWPPAQGSRSGTPASHEFTSTEVVYGVTGTDVTVLPESGVSP